MTSPVEGDFDIYGEEEAFQAGEQHQDEVRELLSDNHVVIHLVNVVSCTFRNLNLLRIFP